MVDTSFRDSQRVNSVPGLIFRRWADLGFLFLTAIGVGIIICPALEVAQQWVAQFLLPWGWLGGLFVGLVAATITWVILMSLGARLAPGRAWMTNPSAWPLGIVSFMLCSFVWQCRVGPERLAGTVWAVQAVGAVLVFLCGGVLASLFLWVSGTTTFGIAGIPDSEAMDSLDELAKDPERLIEWLDREEPVSCPGEDYFDAASYARRIAALVRDNPVRTIGLVGPHGCGKSSILRIVRRYLQGSCANVIRAGSEEPCCRHDVIVCEVSGWGFQEGTIAHHILDAAIRELSHKIDCLEVASIPATYQRIMGDSGGFTRTLYALVSSHKESQEVLRRLDEVVAQGHMRLVIFIEDVDRNIRGDDFFNELAALLEGLKDLDNITFVLAIGQKYEGQEIMAKLCEHIEVVPNLPHGPVLAILRTFREYCLEKYADDCKAYAGQGKDGGPSFESSVEMDRFAQARLISRPIDGVCKLLTSPRILKTSLRRTWLAWRRIHGEIDFDHLLICGAMRMGAPEAFFLINENIAFLQGLSSPSDTDEGRNRDTQIRDSLRKQFMERSQKGDWSLDGVDELVGLLFPGWERQPWSRDLPAVQGICIGEPTDYWARLNREELLPHEIRDQEIIRAIESWRQDRNAPVFRDFRIQNALLEVEGVAAKVEQLGDMLTPKEVRDIAGGVFDLILKKEKIAGAPDYPGFAELWRLSLKKPYDSHDKWIKCEIQGALRVSLRFANDLYQYWRYQSEHMNANYPTHELRDYVVRVAQGLYGNDHGVYMHALDRGYPWSTKHLVVTYASPDEGGPGIESEDWSWFGPVLLSAASVDPQLGIPQIAVLLTEYERKPGDRGSFVHKSIFSDSIAQRVFGEERMRDLMVLLERNFQPQEYDVEISTRFGCCQGRAKEWLREHPK